MTRGQLARRRAWGVILAITAACAVASAAAAASPLQGAQRVLRRLVLEHVTVYTHDDVLWLLDLQEGKALVRTPDAIAAALQDRYERDGYTAARVTATVAEDGTLTLRVDEGRIDAIELRGVTEAQAARLRERLDVEVGDVYNKRTVTNAADRLVRDSADALSNDEPFLESDNGRRVLVVPLQWRHAQTRVSLNGTAEPREDLFSPVDGFNPSIDVSTTIFDHGKLNHTIVDGFIGYKFQRDRAGFAVGAERPLFGSPKLFVGGEVHDLTTSDDWWRVTGAEQFFASLAFKNTFRDYYRRKGVQVFSTLQAGSHNELTLMARWDRMSPLENATDFSLFRGDAAYRPNAPATDGDVNAWMLGYRFDTRGVTGAGDVQTYRRHLYDSLYGFGQRREPGFRLEWTSELAGHGLGGDTRFDRHILDLRGYLAFSRRQLLSGRGLFGFSGGTLPPEREFGLGGIGSVHGYAFKEARGTGMALMNAEYSVDLTPPRSPGGALLSVFAFYDAGRVSGPLRGSRGDWLQGVGFGFASGTWLRVDFGFRADAIPSSRQILVRLGPTF